jgi:predicted nucleotidyltransferase
MKTIGIIAEYNPFHNGHAYQIEKIRQKTGADYVVAAMSGEFVQRGAPAVIDKFSRTKMALSCGVDLVVELPVVWSTASAEDFAMAGVTLFDRMGCIDGLCFGAETDNLALFCALADILAEEPPLYRSLLSSYIKEGLTFPAARQAALLDYMTGQISSDIPTAASDSFLPKEIAQLLGSPNNILALEYIKAIKKRNSFLLPLPIKREGAAYHSRNLTEKNASATAIRKYLLTQNPAAPAVDFFKGSLPWPAYQILSSYCEKYPPLKENDFSSALGYLLLSRTMKGFVEYGDCSSDISNRIVKNIYDFRDFTSFCQQMKSRDITYTRMSRILTHILLSITKEDYMTAKSMDYIPYLRILGFRRDAAPLLSSIKKTASVPLLSKLADADNHLTNKALRMLERDIFAGELYRQVRATTSGKGLCNASFVCTPGSEYSCPLVIL